MFNDTLNTIIAVLGGDASNPKCQSSSESSLNTISGNAINRSD